MALYDEIHSRADCAAALASKDCNALAAIVSVGRKSIRSRFVTARTILAEISGGGTVLKALEKAAIPPATPSATDIEVSASVEYALKFLGQPEGLDAGTPAVQGLCDLLITRGALTAAQGNALKALASQSTPVTAQEVASVIFNPDGSTK